MIIVLSPISRMLIIVTCFGFVDLGLASFQLLTFVLLIFGPVETNV